MKRFSLFIFLIIIAKGVLSSVAHAQANTINLSAGQRPACSSSTWTVNNNVYRCMFGQIQIPQGTTVIANSAAVLSADGGIIVNNGSQIGTGTTPVSLQSSYGAMTINQSVIHGSISSASGAIVLRSSQVDGSIVTTSGGGNVSVLAQSTVRGGINATGNVTVQSSQVLTDVVSTNGQIRIESGSDIQGAVRADSSTVTIQSATVTGDITAPRGRISLESNAQVTGYLRSACCEISVTDSRLIGGADSGNNNVIIARSVIRGEFRVSTSNNRIRITESTVLSGSLNAWGIEIDNLSQIGTEQAITIDYQEHGGLNSGSSLNAICTPAHARCAGQSQVTRPILSMCTDVWLSPVRGNDQRYPGGLVQLPESALQSSPLPQNLQPIDYLRRGNFADVGADWTVNQATARVYVDGNLTIPSGRRLNANGPPENLILVVTGNLTVGTNVVLNGYVYVGGTVDFDAPIPIFGTPSRLNGGLTAGGTIRNSNRATITHTPVNRQIQGGEFCLGQPRQELWLNFNDGPWSGSNPRIADSSPIQSPVINPTNGFRFNQNPLQSFARNGVGFRAGGPDSALNANVDPGGLGTCGFADFNETDGQFVEVELSPRLDMSGSFTIGTWVYPRRYPAANNLMTIASRNENYEFHLTPNGRINWWWMNLANQVREFNSSQQVPLNRWSYVGIRYTPTEQTIFIWNGQQLQLTTFNDSSGMRQTTVPLRIGADQEPLPRYFNGRLDEFRVIRGALSNAELVQLGQERATQCGRGLVCLADEFPQQDRLGLLWQTSASSGNFVPRVENSRLRLNTATGDQATVASLRRAFPAADNYLEVTFSFSAYGGNLYNGSQGGDGIALVFSDATVVPVPGSYGGSLGYAQRDSSGGGVPGPGFAGGWLGVGLDVYGNFAQAAEGRVGGLNQSLAQTRNRVSLRGAQQTQYRYIRSSAQQSGMSVSGATPSSDRYRVIIDSRGSNTSMVSVERDRGSGFDMIIEPFDVFAALQGQQPAVPDLLRLSFTGSTGGAFNIHEIDDFQVCALVSRPLGESIDHVRLSHSGELVSCYSETVEVVACTNPDCSQRISGAGSIQLQASAGNWVGVPTSGTGGRNAAIPLVNGIGRASLQHVPGGLSAFTLLGTDPLLLNPGDLRCFQGNVYSGPQVPCQVQFNTAGLAFVDPDNINARMTNPHTIAGENFSRAIRAVRTNTLTGACEARIANRELNVNVGYTCENPATCAPGQQFTVNQTVLNAASLTPVPLVFDNDGVARLRNAVRYTDVGQLRMRASLRLERDDSAPLPQVDLTGESESFVSRPHTLRAVALNSNGSEHVMTSVDAPAFKAAGESFGVMIQSLNAQGNPTPSFGREALTPAQVRAEFGSLLYPSGGRVGQLNSGSGFMLSATHSGALVSQGYSWNEVGSFSLRPSLLDNRYLGISSQPQRQDARVGRFYPANFNLTGSQVMNACLSGASGFTYMNQPAIDVNYTVEALNIGGQRTENYGSGYAQTATFRLVGLANNTSYTERLIVASVSQPQWSLGRLEFNASDIAFARGQMIDGPLSPLQLGVEIITERDSRAFKSDSDFLSPVLSSAVGLDGELDLRYGRLILDNIAGPEDEPLSVRARTEYWNGSRFVRNMDDICTPVLVGNLGVTANPDGLNLESEADHPTVRVRQGDLDSDRVYWINRPEPGENERPGEFEFELDLEEMPWLRYRWSGGADQNPTATGTFGVFRGNERIIYILETNLH